MKGINTYLNFDGTCREAMTFYKDCLGGEVFFMPFAGGPMEVTEQAKDRILHASLRKGAAVLMASDTMPGKQYQPGNNFSVAVGCESLDELEKVFAAFAKKGKVTMPLQDTFWGARFGTISDQFGISWMFDFELPKEAPEKA